MIKLGVSKLVIKLEEEEFLELFFKCDAKKQCKLGTWTKLIIFD